MFTFDLRILFQIEKRFQDHQEQQQLEHQHQAQHQQQQEHSQWESLQYFRDNGVCNCFIIGHYMQNDGKKRESKEVDW